MENDGGVLVGNTLTTPSTQSKATDKKPQAIPYQIYKVIKRR
jgi:hypothetical protein